MAHRSNIARIPTMKLYYAPGACSMAVHIALVEAGVPFDVAAVDLKAKTIAGDGDYWAVNAKGSVPALQLDDGAVLTEVGALLQYVADLNPGSGLAPPHGTLARYQLVEWINFIATEIHKTFGPLWNPQLAPDVREATHQLLLRRFDYAGKRLASTPYLMGDTFTVADAYLYTMLVWTKFVKFDLSARPALQDYMKRIAARASVQQVRTVESGGK
jgi:glutathione S-transferase